MAVWALIGFMGCGKSSIGRTVQRLATASPVADTDSGPVVSGKMLFIDLDEEIVQREGRSIPEIFSAVGESGFRAIERDTLAQLLSAVSTCPFGSSLRSPHHPFGTVPPLSNRGCYVPQGQVPLPDRAQLKNDLHPSDLLLSLGGGTLTDEGSRELVKKNCKCIYLRATVETLAANLREAGTEGRPMLAGVNLDAPASAPDSLESHIASMMATRGPIYEKAADIILDIDGLSYEQAARQILSIKSSGS